MDRFDRIHTLHRLLKQPRHPLPAERLMHELECSRVTLTRLIEYMRDFLNAPIRCSRQRGGYWYERDAAAYELPGVWFHPSELYALRAPAITASGTARYGRARPTGAHSADGGTRSDCRVLPPHRQYRPAASLFAPALS